jgi:hypothetical protein
MLVQERAGGKGKAEETAGKAEAVAQSDPAAPTGSSSTTGED